MSKKIKKAYKNMTTKEWWSALSDELGERQLKYNLGKERQITLTQGEAELIYRILKETENMDAVTYDVYIHLQNRNVYEKLHVKELKEVSNWHLEKMFFKESEEFYF